MMVNAYGGGFCFATTRVAAWADVGLTAAAGIGFALVTEVGCVAVAVSSAFCGFEAELVAEEGRDDMLCATGRLSVDGRPMGTSFSLPLTLDETAEEVASDVVVAAAGVREIAESTTVGGVSVESLSCEMAASKTISFALPPTTTLTIEPLAQTLCSVASSSSSEEAPLVASSSVQFGARSAVLSDMLT